MNTQASSYQLTIKSNQFQFTSEPTLGESGQGKLEESKLTSALDEFSNTRAEGNEASRNEAFNPVLTTDNSKDGIRKFKGPDVDRRELEEKGPTAANQVERKVQSPSNKILNFQHTSKEDFKNLKQINKEVRKQGIQFRNENSVLKLDL